MARDVLRRLMLGIDGKHQTDLKARKDSWVKWWQEICDSTEANGMFRLIERIFKAIKELEERAKGEKDGGGQGCWLSWRRIRKNYYYHDISYLVLIGLSMLNHEGQLSEDAECRAKLKKILVQCFLILILDETAEISNNIYRSDVEFTTYHNSNRIRFFVKPKCISDALLDNTESHHDIERFGEDEENVEESIQMFLVYMMNHLCGNINGCVVLSNGQTINERLDDNKRLLLWARYVVVLIAKMCDKTLFKQKNVDYFAFRIKKIIPKTDRHWGIIIDNLCNIQNKIK